MIPRFKPFLGTEELKAPFQHIPQAVSTFETEFAKKFAVKSAISFPYGRSALRAFFISQAIKNAEIIIPAYTCSVVAHSVVLSGNIPRFVDIRLDDFNMDLDQVEKAITSRTKAVIATHLFGYPLDFFRLKSIVEKAEAVFGHKIWIIQDCAHSFAAVLNGQSTANQPDVSIFGLNISKQITSIFGGMLTTDVDSAADAVREWRDSNFHQPGAFKTFRRWLYLLGANLAFFAPFYGLVYTLQFRTRLLNYLTRAYHLEEEIVFPPDHEEFMLPIEAKVGLAQLKKYDSIIQQRRANAAYLHKSIQPRPGWIMPPLVEGATYSHYVVRVPDRERIMKETARQGVQLGELIEYCIPEWDVYRPYAIGQEFPNSSLCSRTTINLPIYAGLKEKDRAHIAAVINSISSSEP